MASIDCDVNVLVGSRGCGASCCVASCVDVPVVCVLVDCRGVVIGDVCVDVVAVRGGRVLSLVGGGGGGGIFANVGACVVAVFSPRS